MSPSAHWTRFLKTSPTIFRIHESWLLAHRGNFACWAGEPSDSELIGGRTGAQRTMIPSWLSPAFHLSSPGVVVATLGSLQAALIGVSWAFRTQHKRHHGFGDNHTRCPTRSSVLPRTHYARVFPIARGPKEARRQQRRLCKKNIELR